LNGSHSADGFGEWSSFRSVRSLGRWKTTWNAADVAAHAGEETLVDAVAKHVSAMLYAARSNLSFQDFVAMIADSQMSPERPGIVAHRSRTEDRRTHSELRVSREPMGQRDSDRESPT
jgi:hypothetical protein